MAEDDVATLMIQEMVAQLQYIVDWADTAGMLEDHCFTFPNGETIHATTGQG